MADSLRIAAGDAGFDERIQQLSESVNARFRYHTIELPDGRLLPGLQSVEHLRWRLGLFDLPEDLTGKRVLDIGAWDGWFSFECERRGAQVVAVDCVELDTFLEAKQLLGSKVEYLTLDVSELSARTLGRFDIVLFFGVLYHLRHPLAGLEKAVELSTGRVLIESFVIPAEARPIPSVMEFYETNELGGQIDNWCGPSPECLLAMCRSAGFAQVELRDITNGRASVLCHRRWPETAANPAIQTPHLHSAVNNRTYVARFHPAKDEYVCCYFKSPETALTPPDVRVAIDGFGLPSLSVNQNGPGAWQVNCLRPPGLDAGRHRVQLRVRGSALSNAAEFIMLDEFGHARLQPADNLPVAPPELCSAEFQPSRDLRIAANRRGSLIFYFRSDLETIGTADIELDGVPEILHPHTIGSLGDNLWQANILLTESLPARAAIRIRFSGGGWSTSTEVT